MGDDGFRTNRTLPLGVLRLLASEGATAVARSGVQCCPNLAGDQDGQIAVHLGWRHPGVGPLDKSVDHLWAKLGWLSLSSNSVGAISGSARSLARGFVEVTKADLRVNVTGRSHPGCPGPGPSIVDFSRDGFAGHVDAILPNRSGPSLA